MKSSKYGLSSLATHRFHGVGEQVQENFLHLEPVDGNRWKRVPEFQTNRYGVVLDVSGNQGE
jgi:hypothetical protein